MLDELVADIADAIVALDRSAIPFKEFQAGAGPYGEPQLVRAIAGRLTEAGYPGVAVKRSPDLLIRDRWALEFKIARPFGDNGKPAENWSVNLLHPYPGNQSAIGDGFKLRSLPIPERKAVVVVGYQHATPQVDLDVLFQSFELVAARVCGLALGPRVSAVRLDLIHPIHQCVRVVAWEVLR